MRKSRFGEEQMVAILREADRTTVAEAAKKHKLSEQTIYSWRKHFGELAPSDVKCLCGQVQICVRGEPLRVGICHCTHSRRESGSAFTFYAVWP